MAYKNDNNRKGFTLLEILIYMAMFSFVLGSLCPLLYVFSAQSQSKIDGILKEEDLIFIQEKIAYEATHAVRIILSPGSTSSILQLIKQDGSSETISLAGQDVELSANGMHSILNSSVLQLSKLNFDFSQFASSSVIGVELKSLQMPSLSFSIYMNI